MECKLTGTFFLLLMLSGAKSWSNIVKKIRDPEKQIHPGSRGKKAPDPGSRGKKASDPDPQH
jgi:hypothetical protein